MSSLLKDMADYGYNDVNLYKAVLAECMRERRRAEIKAFPDRLFSLLTGLAYLQIYPVELFEILFSGVQLIPTHANQLKYNNNRDCTVIVL